MGFQVLCPYLQTKGHRFKTFLFKREALYLAQRIFTVENQLKMVVLCFLYTQLLRIINLLFLNLVHLIELTMHREDSLCADKSILFGFVNLHMPEKAET